MIADTAGIKTPNNLTMVLTPSEIWEEARIREIQIVQERKYVRIKNFIGEIARVVPPMIAANRSLLRKSNLLIFPIVLEPTFIYIRETLAYSAKTIEAFIMFGVTSEGWLIMVN
jgi:hypothetical protein